MFGFTLVKTKELLKLQALIKSTQTALDQQVELTNIYEQKSDELRDEVKRLTSQIEHLGKRNKELLVKLSQLETKITPEQHDENEYKNSEKNVHRVKRLHKTTNQKEQSVARSQPKEV